ncbi:uncharacterized protein EV422DRAFT_503916 [Fimicolochytrium jonesii]|uniref:uncharacterized protein n=1 Tax=Fimicolochytrium jonesii TaxID=1396493 RepID=UPI0022FE1B57|nr:uncharacterized protein EV422DRAFT_503916 [Fimicolochytrium jonesii]KAI8825166.1 hypothetical protein EV422DRAFT_503916 [Fimicolochytrium jonesii]
MSSIQVFLLISLVILVALLLILIPIAALSLTSDNSRHPLRRSRISFTEIRNVISRIPLALREFFTVPASASHRGYSAAGGRGYADADGGDEWMEMHARAGDVGEFPPAAIRNEWERDTLGELSGNAKSQKNEFRSTLPRCLTLREIKLEVPIRYASGDPVESWLNKRLCPGPSPDVLILRTMSDERNDITARHHAGRHSLVGMGGSGRNRRLLVVLSHLEGREGLAGLA